MRTIRDSLLVGLLGLTVAMPAAWAQQQTQDQSAEPAQPAQPARPAQPIPALRSPMASAADNGDSQTLDQDSQSLSPDTRPLAGAQDLSLGTPLGGHSFWEPHVSVTSTFNSNPLSTNSSGWANWNMFIGGIDLNRNSENSNLMLTYSGGGSVSTSGGIGNNVIQQFGVVERLMWRRSTISFFDSLGYLPEAAFGYAGINGIPIPGGGTIGLQNGFVPDQGILTAQTQRISNSFFTQAEIQLTPRSSLTILGGYSLLHYFDSDLLNSGGPTFQAGYNYVITREDTVSFFYRFNEFNYSNFNQWIHSNSVQGAYARRVTGRLAFRVGAGPSFTSFQKPINGNSGSGGTGGGTGGSGGTATGPISRTFFAVNTGLTYQLGRAALGLAYSHGISGGSGVLAGSISNFLNGTANRQLTSKLSAVLNAGYSRNSGLSIATTTPSNRTFNYTYVGASLDRLWGRSTTMSLSYQLRYQNSSVPPCVGAACGTNCTGVLCSTSYLSHSVFLNLTWKTQPISF